jgi:tetratricopeptide (TPR) repeat protein
MALNKRYPLLVGACSVALVTGCATTTDPVSLDKSNTKVQPVYRVQQPAGTAAGQYAVGRLDLAEGRVDAAIVRFRNALKLDPTFVEAHNGLGVALGMKGRYDEAAEAFTAALAHSPASAHVLNNLGYAQMKAGRLYDAWRSFGQSLDLDPKNASTRENVRLLADLRRGGGAAPVAAEDTQKALAETPRDVAQERPVVEPRRAEAVHSVSDDSVLVRLSANVYELRRADRPSRLFP